VLKQAAGRYGVLRLRHDESHNAPYSPGFCAGLVLQQAFFRGFPAFSLLVHTGIPERSKTSPQIPKAKSGKRDLVIIQLHKNQKR